MILLRYKHKKVHIVEFEYRYAIDGGLLGKHFAMQVSDNCALEVVIPSIYRNGKFDELGIPDLLNNYGCDINKWGKIDNYVTINDVETANACISAVLVICYAKNEEAELYFGAIQNMVRKVLHTLHILNPHVIRVNSDTVPNDLCEINVSVKVKDDGEKQAEIMCPPMLIVDMAPRLSFADIKRAIRNYHRTVSLPYEMLEHARVNLSNHDTRAAVLNCATAIEVTLKKMLNDYLESNHVPDKLKMFVLKRADRYAKLAEVLKDLSLIKKKMDGVKVYVMDVRNRIIHGGYIPSHEEAGKSYSCIRKALADIDVKMFE